MKMLLCAAIQSIFTKTNTLPINLQIEKTGLLTPMNITMSQKVRCIFLPLNRGLFLSQISTKLATNNRKNRFIFLHFAAFFGNFIPFGVFFSNSDASFGLVAYRNLRCASDLKGMAVNFTTNVRFKCPFVQSALVYRSSHHKRWPLRLPLQSDCLNL